MIAAFTQELLGLETINSIDDVQIRFETMISHKFFPGDMGVRVDGIVGLSVLIMLLMIINLILSPPMNAKHHMFIVDDIRNGGKTIQYLDEILNKAVAQKIINFRAKCRTIVYRVFPLFYAAVQIYFLQLIIRMGYWSWNFQTILYWFVVWPPFIGHAIFCKLFFIILSYFFFIKKYIFPSHVIHGRLLCAGIGSRSNSAAPSG